MPLPPPGTEFKLVIIKNSEDVLWEPFEGNRSWPNLASEAGCVVRLRYGDPDSLEVQWSNMLPQERKNLSERAASDAQEMLSIESKILALSSPLQSLKELVKELPGATSEEASAEATPILDPTPSAKSERRLSLGSKTSWEDEHCMVPPTSDSWEFPLSREEKKARVVMLLMLERHKLEEAVDAFEVKEAVDASEVTQSKEAEP